MRGLLLLLCLLPVRAAFGHGLDPALLSLDGTGDGRFAVTWRTSAQRLPGADVRPILPAHCRPGDASPPEATLEHVTLRWTIDCGAAGLVGETIRVQDLDAARINALLRIEQPSAPTIQVVLSPRHDAFVVPAQPTAWDVVRGYVGLGVEHILSGPDHLLFVFGLLLLLATPRALLAAVTAFTVGHSLTLSAAALGLATVPSRPIEVLIAASVLALAVELTRDGGDTAMRRFPWIVALGFGLLHGFGFAGALAETGLPPGDIPLALLAFNTGIELGQLAFIAAVLASGALAWRALPAAAAWARRPAIYAMGILAAFWCFERTAVWLG
ncbi:MAG: HupE/UreJ family protein [bacterium]|nr:HupE/UreJ family protein [bacterium]